MAWTSLESSDLSSERTSVIAATAAVWNKCKHVFGKHNPFEVTNLLVDDGTETGLALDDGVGDTHLAAESWKEDDKLDRVNVVGDQDESRLLRLDEGDNVVETVLDDVGLLADVLLLLALGDGSGLLGETLLLVGLGLRAVLVEELEGLSGSVAVKNIVELGDGRGDLQAHVQDLALALQADVGGPLDEAGEVAPRLDVLANTEVLRAALNERVLRRVSTSSRLFAQHWGFCY